MRCKNRDVLLNLSFILKIPIFSEVYLPSWTYMVQRFFCRNRQWVLTQGVKQGNNLGVGRGECSKPNPSEVSQLHLGSLRGAVRCPSRRYFLGGEPPYKNCLAFRGVINWLKIYPHLVVFFFHFFFYFLYVVSLRALKNL